MRIIGNLFVSFIVNFVLSSFGYNLFMWQWWVGMLIIVIIFTVFWKPRYD